MRRHTFAVVFILGMLPAAVAGQATQPPAQTPERDYIVGPQDVLSITVYNEPSLSGRFTVESDGSIT
jgi:protein involved in polysaccharide export with SLBB domain